MHYDAVCVLELGSASHRAAEPTEGERCCDRLVTVVLSLGFVGCIGSAVAENMVLAFLWVRHFFG